MQPVQDPLEIVLAKNRPRLMRQARRLCCGSTIDPDDLVQDVCLRFMNAFQERPLPEDEGCAAWLTTTLRNSFISQLRKARVQVRVWNDPALPESMGSSSELPDLPEPTAREVVTDEEMGKAVCSLSPKLRRVFELSAAGQSYDEIAKALGILRGAVAKRLHDARKRLRKILKANHPEVGAVA